jgi:hypothetical protein
MSDVPQLVSIKEACRIIGGNESPVHPSTYYRGVRNGIYPAPVHPSPNISRVEVLELAAALRARINNEK